MKPFNLEERLSPNDFRAWQDPFWGINNPDLVSTDELKLACWRCPFAAVKANIESYVGEDFIKQCLDKIENTEFGVKFSPGKKWGKWIMLQRDKSKPYLGGGVYK